jgi:hypothetical protein
MFWFWTLKTTPAALQSVFSSGRANRIGFKGQNKSARKYGKAGTTPRRLTVVGFLAPIVEKG